MLLIGMVVEAMTRRLFRQRVPVYKELQSVECVRKTKKERKKKGNEKSSVRYAAEATRHTAGLVSSQ
jgi:hypothetical protein